MAVSVEHLAMPNLLAGEAVYPEFIQHEATPESIARAVLELLNDARQRDAIKTKLAQIVRSLANPAPVKERRKRS